VPSLSLPWLFGPRILTSWPQYIISGYTVNKKNCLSFNYKNTVQLPNIKPHSLKDSNIKFWVL
jgi:hypothetical protein